jgi:hypothetical protein
MRAALLPLLLTCTLGCSSVRLATLQSDFDDLYGARQACAKRADAREAPDAPGPELPCEGQDVALYELALDAEKAARRAGDPRTRIALLRLAGVAAWQGAGREADALVAKAALEGVTQCDALEEQVRRQETWGAPRDCAVLVLLPALLAHDVQLERLARLRAAGACATGDVSLAELVDSWADSTVLFVQRREAKALGYRGLSPGVRRYVAETKRRMMCNFEKVRTLAPATCPTETARAGEEKRRIEAELGTTFLDACG